MIVADYSTARHKEKHGYAFIKMVGCYLARSIRRRGVVFAYYYDKRKRFVGGELLTFFLIAGGAVLFANWLFGIVEERERVIHRRSEQLRVLHEAALALTTELDLGTVLQKVVDLARQLANARYGALSVLDEQGRFTEQFVTSGITQEQWAKLGTPPRGHGLLGVLIHEGKPIRIPDIGGDSRSVGFPPHHPLMHTLLGVSIKSKRNVIGDLYLTDKLMDFAGKKDEYTTFTERDQQVLEMFATQAAIAIEPSQMVDPLQIPLQQSSA